MRPACYANVYLDRMLIYDGRQPLPDVNSIVPDVLEAVEFYEGAAQIPAMYQRLNTNCGVLVLWTRRTFGDSTQTLAPAAFHRQSSPVRQSVRIST